MSTDSQQQKQNKSMFILLSIISILVISTLVVASVYFLKPTIKAPNHESLTQAPIETHVDRVTVNPFIQSNLDDTQKQNMKSLTDTKKTTLAEVAVTQTNAKTEKQNKQDNCDIHFSENQLLVKNSDRSK